MEPAVVQCLAPPRLLVLQPRKGKAKPYQVRQVLRVLEAMEEFEDD
ncbi:hypothetical protein [Candidatus Poriferisocius sp.]